MELLAAQHVDDAAGADRARHHHEGGRLVVGAIPDLAYLAGLLLLYAHTAAS